jgi:SAM-dependent methyltransferase
VSSKPAQMSVDREVIGGHLNKSHWADFHRRWAQLTPPLRPNKEIAEGLRQAIAGHAERVLLLGVTPELADLGAEVVGVDHSEMMIANIWPGDTERRRVVKADWLALPFPKGHFSAAIGDGSLNALSCPIAHRRLYEQLAHVIRPGGRFAVRLYKTPDRGEPLAVVRNSAVAGEIGSFHAFKWRLAMAIVAAAADPNIRVETIREVFNREFPDRAALASASGWPAADIDTIDVYKGSSEVYSFPTFDQLRTAIPDSFTDPRLVPVGSYELAERCPLVVMDLKG